MTPGLIVGIVLLVALIVAFVYILRQNPNAPRRHKRVIEDE
jgi:uncharacterized membrane protein (DUF485 family)